jgi:hypothetical protein
LLTYTYASLDSASDRIDFSRDSGATWTYTPVADVNGCDGNVTNSRVRLGGNLDPLPCTREIGARRFRVSHLQRAEQAEEIELDSNR